jgi:hypothetical protein
VIRGAADDHVLGHVAAFLMMLDLSHGAGDGGGPLQAFLAGGTAELSPMGRGPSDSWGGESIYLRFLYRVRALDTCRIAAVCLPYCGRHLVGYPHARNTLSESQGEA